MSARHRDDLLADLVDLCRECHGYVRDLDPDAFLADQARVRAVERTLELIGEATTQLGDDLPEVDAPWDKIRRLRVLLAHIYHKVDPTILYETAKNGVPRLLDALKADR